MIRENEASWAEDMPDPVTRYQWMAVFGSPRIAKAFSAHFTDPLTARAWANLGLLDPATAGYLDTHGITPDRSRIKGANDRARDETPRPHFLNLPHTRTRAALLLVHPNLSRQDRDSIMGANLTLTEVDHLLATGTYDRTQLDLIGALQ